MNEKEMSNQEAENMLRELAEQKQNTHSFFRNIIMSEDTTKTGNLSEEELGETKLPVRSLKELSIFSKQICIDKGWEKYFDSLSESITATSLSKEGLLIKLSVTSKKELADVSPKSNKKNKGWFKKKE